MLQDRNNVSSPDGGGNRSQSNDNNNASQPFESDTQRIVHRHLHDKNDVITDEDIASIRVGMNPADYDTANNEQLQNAEEEVAERNESDENDEGERVTPWDTVSPDE